MIQFLKRIPWPYPRLAVNLILFKNAVFIHKNPVTPVQRFQEAKQTMNYYIIRNNFRFQTKCCILNRLPRFKSKQKKTSLEDFL